MPSRSCPDRLVRVAVPAPAMTPPRRTLDVSSLSATQGAAYASKGAPARIRAACRAGCLPLADALPVLSHPGPGGDAGSTGSIHPEAAGSPRQPLAGGDAAPNSCFHGCAIAAIVSAAAGRTNASAHARTGNLDA